MGLGSGFWQTVRDRLGGDLRGATAAARFAGGTVSGAPTEGRFLKGDAIFAQNGHLWICTAAGAPGTWTDVGGQSTTDLLAALGMSATVVETMPRSTLITAMVAPTDGTLYLTYFTPLVNVSVSTITVLSSASSAASGLTLARLGLYAAAANGDVTLVARTANNTSLLGTTSTSYSEGLSTTGGFPASYSLAAGSRYAVGVLQVGTTPGRVLGAGPSTTAGLGLLAPVFTASKASQADISGNVSSVAANVLAAPYFRLS